MTRASSILSLVALLLFSHACGPRYLREIVVSEDGNRVFLRAEQRDGKIVPRAFDHPAPIAPVRIVNILARLDRRTGEGDDEERGAAVHSEVIYQIADGVSQALGQATPDQEVVVMARRSSRNLVLFTQEHLTSFVAFMRDDQLHLHFGHLDWSIPKHGDEADDIKEPRIGRQLQEFRLIAGEGMTLTGTQSVAVDWRDPGFGKATTLRVGNDGSLVRRTVLMEDTQPLEGEAEADTGDADALPGDLSSAQLRALADLEDSRRLGRITEAQYQARRRAILAGETR